jgi:hypothetical protein
MSNVTATRKEIRGTQWLRIVASLLLGFSIGVDVTRWHAESAFVLNLFTLPGAIVIMLIGAFLQKRQSEQAHQG